MTSWAWLFSSLAENPAIYLVPQPRIRSPAVPPRGLAASAQSERTIKNRFSVTQDEIDISHYVLYILQQVVGAGCRPRPICRYLQCITQYSLAFVAVLATRFLTALRLKDMKGKLDGIKPANSIAIPDERQQVLEAAEEVS